LGLITKETFHLLNELKLKTLKSDNDLIFDKSEDAMKKSFSRLFTQQLKVPITSHDFRHTKITELAESGM
jgi:integrase